MEQRLKKLQQDIKEKYEIPELSMEQIERLKLKMEQAKRKNRRDRIGRVGMRMAAAAAGVVLVLFVLTNTSKTVAMAMQQIPLLGEFVKIITVRNYEYEDERHYADINVDQLIVSALPELEYVDEQVKVELKKTADAINADIQQVTLELVEQFEQDVQENYGPEEILVESEVIPTTADYFVIKLLCYQSSGSGYQWNYYYTIDLTTGKQISLADLFMEGAEYITPISENIIAQMRQQMAEDPGKIFDIDAEDGHSADIAGVLRERQSFYVNERGNVVISFDEGEVAAMYMGPLEFEIDSEVIENIRK